MRIMGVFDWLLAVKDYITAEVEDPWKESETVTPSLLLSRPPARSFHSAFIVLNFVDHTSFHSQMNVF